MTSATFGLVLHDGKTDLVVEAKDISEIKQKGAEFKLERRVRVGTISGGVNAIEERFGVKVPKADDLPPPLKEAVEAITEITWWIDELTLKMAPAKDNNKKTASFKVRGELKNQLDLVSSYKLKGFVLGGSVGDS